MARARATTGSRTHPSARRVAASAVAVATALLIGAPAGHAGSPQRARIMSRLGQLPYSSGVLQAMAVHAGLLPKVGSGPGSPAGGTAPTVLANVQANPASDTAPVNEDPITADPKTSGTSTVLLSGGNDYNCPSSGVSAGFYLSTDDGATFVRHCFPDVSTSLYGCGDPAVGFNLGHTAFIGSILGDCFGTGSGSIYVQKNPTPSNPGTWTAPALAISPPAGGLADKPWLEVDQNSASLHKNRIYISDTQFDTANGSQIAVAHSNNGTSWTTVNVSSHVAFPTVDQFSDLAIGSDGTVYVSYMQCVGNGPTGDCGGTSVKFFVQKSTDGGTTWTPAVQVATAKLAPDSCNAFYGCVPQTSERLSDIPVIAVDNSTGPNAGHVYVAYYTFATTTKLEVATSADGGATWGTPVNVRSHNNQVFPWLSVSKAGKLGVSYIGSPNTASPSFDAYATTSSDGSTFAGQTKISTASSPWTNDGFGGGFIGDYTGNFWTGRELHACWMSTAGKTVSVDMTGGLST